MLPGNGGDPSAEVGGEFSPRERGLKSDVAGSMGLSRETPARLLELEGFGGIE